MTGGTVSTLTTVTPAQREPELLGQTVVVKPALTGATYDVDGGQKPV
jgi:hypothetical protein